MARFCILSGGQTKCAVSVRPGGVREFECTQSQMSACDDSILYTGCYDAKEESIIAFGQAHSHT